ncbi:sulfite exporter TauE/SafE family protein [Methanoregula sp.]|uniref:sulfite exporter TauE/SafE family protein n=1 Tax=Methanoregula sp. TaxID=2052170 RepID=UPI00356ADA33
MILPVFAFLIALAIGIVAALVGLGGGFLYVPTLTLIFGLDQRMAVGTSLAVTVCASAAAAFCCARQKKILYTAAGCLIIPGMIGAALGAALTAYIDTRILVILFVLVLFLISVQMLRPACRLVGIVSRGPVLENHINGPGGENSSVSIPYAHLILWGTAGGLVSGTTGISGGVLFVPALVVAGIPVHYAVATSLFAIVLTSLAGAGTQAALGNVSLPFLAAYGTGAAIGAYAGASIAPKIRADRIQAFFGAMLLVIAVLMILHGIF